MKLLEKINLSWS